MRQRRSMWFLGLFAAWVVFAGAYSATLKEASAKFGVANVAPILERVSKLIDSGFAAGERDPIVAFVQGMKVDDTFSRTFSVKRDGHEFEFRVEAVMEPHETARMAFFTAPELTDSIQSEMNAFLDALDK